MTSVMHNIIWSNTGSALTGSNNNTRATNIVIHLCLWVHMGPLKHSLNCPGAVEEFLKFQVKKVFTDLWHSAINWADVDFWLTIWMGLCGTHPVLKTNDCPWASKIIVDWIKKGIGEGWGCTSGWLSENFSFNLCSPERNLTGHACSRIQSTIWGKKMHIF